MAKQFRRLVTGHDKDGKSVVLFDGAPPTVLATDARPGATMTGIWDTTTSPASYAGSADAYAHSINLMPPRRGPLDFSAKSDGSPLPGEQALARVPMSRHSQVLVMPRVSVGLLNGR